MNHTITIDLSDLSPWGLHKTHTYFSKTTYTITDIAKIYLEQFLDTSLQNNKITLTKNTISEWAIETIFNRGYRYLYIEDEGELPIFIGFNSNFLAAELLDAGKSIYYNPLLNEARDD